MILTNVVVQSCINQITSHSNAVAVIIPERSIGEGFWARCKTFEKTFYIGNNEIEASRFFKREIFLTSGGYDKALISGEDWELGRRIRKYGDVIRINEYIIHNEGKLTFFGSLRKKLYYAKKYRQYEKKVGTTKEKQRTVLHRYQLYFSQPKKLLTHPLLTIGMLFENERI